MKYVAVVAIILLVVSGMIATPQQSVSGGQSVTITQGGNTAIVTAAGAQKVDGSAVTQPVSGTFWQATQPVSLSVLPALATGSNLIGKVNIVPLDGCGGTNYDSGIITIPNTTTVLTATATCVNSVILINLTSSFQSCTVTDGQGTPANLIPPSFSIQPNSDIVFNRYGVKAVGGIKWSCVNAASVAGIVRGDQ